jgi:hypothetical protein
MPKINLRFMRSLQILVFVSAIHIFGNIYIFSQCSNVSISQLTLPCPGATSTKISVSFTPQGTVNYYQWFDVTTTQTNITNNATYTINTSDYSLTINNPSSLYGRKYQFMIVCNGSATFSNILTLAQLNTAPVITTGPSDISVCGDQPGSLSVTVAGTGLTYQWYWDANTTGNSMTVPPVNPPWSGQQTNTLNMNPAVVAGQYWVVVTNACNLSTTSAHAIVTKRTNPTINSHPVSLNQCEGTTASFSFLASGHIYSIWRKDGIDIPNTVNTNTYDKSDIQTSDNGSSYDVRVIAANNCEVFTNAATLVVRPKPTVNASYSGDPCNGPVELSATGASTYLWSPNFRLSSTIGANVNAVVNSAITYTVIGTSNDCSSQASVFINPQNCPSYYGKLSKTLSGSYYTVVDNKLAFTFEEEYYTAPGEKINLRILDNGTEVATAAQFTGTEVTTGTNYYTFNISSILTQGKVYLLEVANKKGEKWYLRFKY